MRALAGDSLPSALSQRPEHAEGETAESEPAASPEPVPTAESAAPPEPVPAAGLAAASAPETDAAAAAEPSPAPAPGRVSEASGRAPAPAPHVLIVGGGAVGGALAHDLALRGFRVTVVEKGELASGATGRSQGLLHSGARYVTTNRRLAVECAAENKILRRIAPGTFEENDGLYVAVTDEDADFAPQFLEACWQSAVSTRRLTREQAVHSEPGLNPQIKMAVQVPDATMDSMRVPLRFFATARLNGADIRHFTEVVAVRVVGGAATGVRVRDRATDREYEIGADLIVKAAGAWAGRVAALAGSRVAFSIASGVMASVNGRHVNMAVSRLHAPGDSDTLLPERRATILGPIRSTSDRPEDGSVDPEKIEELRHLGGLLIPSVAEAEIRARWTARQTIARKPGAVEIGEALMIDHGNDPTPIHGFLTLTGGPATTMRSTAQAAADWICGEMGIDRRCETADTPLLPHTAWYTR
jgi:glycerol-3-phosphate dehydrogenase